MKLENLSSLMPCCQFNTFTLTTELQHESLTCEPESVQLTDKIIQTIIRYNYANVI